MQPVDPHRRLGLLDGLEDAKGLLEGKLLELPGRMSFSRVVPAAVPSLFQSSVPVTPSDARKIIGVIRRYGLIRNQAALEELDREFQEE